MKDLGTFVSSQLLPLFARRKNRYRKAKQEIHTDKTIKTTLKQLLSDRHSINCCACLLTLFEMRKHTITRENTKKIYKIRARLDVKKFSFPNRVINNWNELPEWMVNADTIKSLNRIR